MRERKWLSGFGVPIFTDLERLQTGKTSVSEEVVVGDEEPLERAV